MEKINKRQKAIYDFIKERINDKGIAPSVREIGEAVGLRSTSSVQYNLNALEQAGYIIRDANLKRTVRVVGAAKGVNHIPLVGTVTAGMPILATEIIEDYIAVSGVSGNNLFALRVKGELMLTYLTGILLLLSSALRRKTVILLLHLWEKRQQLSVFIKRTVISGFSRKMINLSR